MGDWGLTLKSDILHARDSYTVVMHTNLSLHWDSWVIPEIQRWVVCTLDHLQQILATALYTY